MKSTIYLILSLFILTGCIEPYEGKTENIDSILVVEGIISSRTTQIALSKSVGLDDGIYGNVIRVNNAWLYVECDDGTISPVAYSSGSGIYMIETGELNANAKYRLTIHADGEEYRSNFLAPAISPPVDVSFTNDENDIHVCITTYGKMDQPGYYLWSYKENWEMHPPIFGTYVKVNGEEIINDLNSPSNRYYCWKKDSSKVLILGTTEKLIENTISEKEIHTFSRTDDRTSVLYRITVKQNTIHKEAYDFFYNLQKNIEQIGSIFGPIPSEIMGNIKCASNPDIPVIGYVDVSTASMDEQYLTNIYYDPAATHTQFNSCALAISTESMPGYVFYRRDMDGTYYIPERCVDCTKIGGIKRKPKDWPNDHQ